MRRSWCSFCGAVFAWIATGIVLAGCGGSSANRVDAAPTDDASDAAKRDAAIDAAKPDALIDAGVSFVCDPIHQTGCRAGEKCDIAGTGTFGCVPDGTLGDFRLCGDKDKPNDCAAGFTCSQTFSPANRCTRICSELEPSCQRNEKCMTEHMTQDGKQYLTCTTHEACNPILDDCVQPNMHCTYLAVANLSVCKIAGTVADGATCQLRSSDAQDCMAGSACLQVGAGGTFKCVRMCNLTGGSPACLSGTCMPFGMVGPQAFGTCSVP